MKKVFLPLGVSIILLTDLISCKDSETKHITSVYVAGETVTKSGKYIATYWKNVATAIAVVGDDVYVAGVKHISTLSIIAKYWKNGVPVSLTDGSGVVYVNGIAVVGNDVYIVGNEDRLGKYWKNGVPSTLTHAIGSAEAITAVGNDIYIVGYELTINQFINVAKYWKNNQSFVLSSTRKSQYINSVHSIFVQ